MLQIMKERLYCPLILTLSLLLYSCEGNDLVSYRRQANAEQEIQLNAKKMPESQSNKQGMTPSNGWAKGKSDQYPRQGVDVNYK